MNLLDQEVKKQEPKGKKIVLFSLIFCVFALIMIIVMMMALSGKKPQISLSLKINSTPITISEGLFTTDEKGVQYISLKKIAKSIGYNYLTGEYKQYSEDITNTKGYLESSNQVIQFEAGSNRIYKVDLTSNLDYEEYKLKNKILKQNNLLYMSLDDLKVGLNVVNSYSQIDNELSLKTVETLYEEYKKSLKEQTDNSLVSISENINNKKAIANNMLVVSNETGKWGVVNSENFSTIIGNKYSSIEFIEQAGVFIVSDNNKYGVISKEKVIVDLNYEKINIINNNPLVYEVRIGENSAIVNEEGVPITNNLYNSFGYSSQNNLEESSLVIKKTGNDKLNILVVCKDKKYGLINLDNGNNIGDCVLDKVYSKTENGEKIYYVQLQGQEILLDSYLEYLNTTELNVEQQ